MYMYSLLFIYRAQEADNWTTLSADVEEVFASQDIQLVCFLYVCVCVCVCDSMLQS